MPDLAAAAPGLAIQAAPALVRPVRSADQWVLQAVLALAALFLLVALVLPMGVLLSRSFQDADGAFVGLANYRDFVATPSLAVSIWNSAWTAGLTTVVVVPLAYVYAYALTRSQIPAKGLFRAVMLIPVLAPSLLPALSLIYLFGNQGMLRGLLAGGTIYGPGGIVAAQVFYTFPQAALILSVALGMADGRIYEAADVLKASRARIFRTVTLPASRYGLVSAAVVVFTLVITDFGIPKVIGGQFSVLATEVYKQVVGLQNFNMGAVVGMVLLLPSVISFALERWAQGQQGSTLSGRAVPYVPKPRPRRDGPLLLFCGLMAVLLVGVTTVAAWGSLITFWPYNLTLTLANYDFEQFSSAGWGSFVFSLQMAGATAVLGTALVFIAAYAVERARDSKVGGVVRILAMTPLAVPGLALGLAYVMFFNAPSNPLGFLYGTIGILVLNTVTHLYTVCHLTAVTAIRQLDTEFESVSASLKVPGWLTFLRVVLPISLPAILDIAVYLFVNAMTTVSAVVFLYGPDTITASIAVLQMDEAGATSAAAAMAVLILGATLLVKLLQIGVDAVFVQGRQPWRRGRIA